MPDNFAQKMIEKKAAMLVEDLAKAGIIITLEEAVQTISILEEIDTPEEGDKIEEQ